MTTSYYASDEEEIQALLSCWWVRGKWCLFDDQVAPPGSFHLCLDYLHELSKYVNWRGATRPPFFYSFVLKATDLEFVSFREKK